MERSDPRPCRHLPPFPGCATSRASRVDFWSVLSPSTSVFSQREGLTSGSPTADEDKAAEGRQGRGRVYAISIVLFPSALALTDHLAKAQIVSFSPFGDGRPSHQNVLMLLSPINRPISLIFWRSDRTEQ